MRRIASLVLPVVLAGCGTMLGRATVNEQPTAGPPTSPPTRIWVGDFPAAEGAVKRPGGIIGAAEELAAERPHLIGGGGLLGGEGPLQRRTDADRPTAAGVSDQLAEAIVAGLVAQNLGVPVERVPAGEAPTSGWLVRGQLLDVDPGNRAQRAVIGFGAGEASTEVEVDVDSLDHGTPTTVLKIGGTSDSGKMPGAVVTMNPYVAAAKFVLGRQATSRDVEKLGEAVAKEIADQARAARAR
jgi:hypothetical protein